MSNTKNREGERANEKRWRKNGGRERGKDRNESWTCEWKKNKRGERREMIHDSKEKRTKKKL